MRARWRRCPLSGSQSSPVHSVTPTRHRPGPIWQARLRAVPASTWAKLGFAGAVRRRARRLPRAPTYPTYDSYYAPALGPRSAARPPARLHGLRGADRASAGDRLRHCLLDLRAARRSADGARRDRLVRGARRRRSTGSARLCFRPIVGPFAALLMLTPLLLRVPRGSGLPRLSYVALDRLGARARGRNSPGAAPPCSCCSPPPSLLRPDAWVLAGALLAVVRARRRELAASEDRPRGWADCCVTRCWRCRRRLWVGLDAIVTGHPLYSLHRTQNTAARSDAPRASRACSHRPGPRRAVAKLPVLLGAIAGGVLAAWLVPRRMRLPSRRCCSLHRHLRVRRRGAVGASVIDRYLLMPAVMR